MGGRGSSIGGGGYSTNDYTHAPNDELNASELIRANELGLKHRETGDWNSYYTPSMQVAYEAGQNGISLKDQPIIKGIRYGKAPEKGLSWNYSENKSEKGLSLAQVKGEKEIGSSNWFKDRKAYEYKGIKTPWKGSDGETLILPLHINFD